MRNAFSSCYPFLQCQLRVQTLPEEICANEEVALMTQVIKAQNNKLKKLPRSLAVLQSLQEVDVQNNIIGGWL